MFDELPKIEHRKTNGRYATRLQTALMEAANWKTLYISEVTRKECVSKTLRIKDEEIIRLKKLIKNP